MSDTAAGQKYKRPRKWRGIDSWFSRHGGLTVLGVSAVSTGLAIFVGVWRWDWLKDAEESVSVTVRNLGLLAAVLPTITLGVWRSSVGNSQAASAQRQADVAHANLLDDRYQQAVSLLAHELLPIRTGGIFALGRLADEHPDEYLPQIIRLMCAFAQSPPPDVSGEDDEDTSSPTAHVLHAKSYVYDATGNMQRALLYHRQPTRHDVAAAIRIAAEGSRRLPEAVRNSSNAHDPHFRLKLDHAKMAQLVLDAIDLSNADLSGADLTHASLISAHLQESMLAATRLTDATLYGANLSGAHLNNADLTGAYLGNTNLTGAELGSTVLYRAELMGADLSGANLWKADLSGAHLGEANFTNANLTDANLTGALVGGRNPVSGAMGLTQSQLDNTVADPDNPPILDGAVDIETGRALIWRGRPAPDLLHDESDED